MEPSFSTSWTLVFGAASGNRTDRERFTERYVPVICAYLAARWKRNSRSEEVLGTAHEVLIQCFKQGNTLGTLDRTCARSFRSFLLGITRHVAAAAERARIRHEGKRDVDVDPRSLEQREATLSQVFDRAFSQMIARAARSLMAQRAQENTVHAERYRILSLRFLKGMKPRDIASSLDFPIGHVYERLREAKEDYRKALYDIVREHHAPSSSRSVEDVCKELVATLS